MKTFIKFSLAILLTMNLAQAQNPFTEFKIGVLDPSDAESGLFFGVNTGRMIDEAISWSIALDFYSSKYTKKTQVDTIPGSPGTPGGSETVTEIENSTLYMPLMVRLNYEKNLPSGLVIRGGAGIGYAFMWVNEENLM